MLFTAVVGVYLALLDVIAFEDFSVSKRIPGESKYTLRA